MSTTTPDRFVSAIRRALAVLGEGGCPDCKCAGCSAEMAEAHRILREALHGDERGASTEPEDA